MLRKVKPSFDEEHAAGNIDVVRHGSNATTEATRRQSVG